MEVYAICTFKLLPRTNIGNGKIINKRKMQKLNAGHEIPAEPPFYFYYVFAADSLCFARDDRFHVTNRKHSSQSRFIL